MEKPSATIYWISDIHLELRKRFPQGILCEVLGLPKDEYGKWIDETTEECTENRQNRILILAGDIGCPHMPMYKLFLAVCMGKFKHVFVVAGNHEYYSREQYTICETNRKMTEICEILGGDAAGIHLLAAGDNDSIKNIVTLTEYNIPLRFIGCTLWTMADYEAEVVMNDYRLISVGDSSSACVDVHKRRVTKPSAGEYRRVYTGNHRGFMAPEEERKRIGARKMQCKDVSKMHQIQLDHISMELVYANIDKICTIVVTHHAPSYSMLKVVENTKSEECVECVECGGEKCGGEKCGGENLQNTKCNEVECEGTKCKKCKENIQKKYGPKAKYYATNLERLIQKPILLWVSGHTHDSKSVLINDVVCSSNCYGYPSQSIAETSFSSVKKVT